MTNLEININNYKKIQDQIDSLEAQKNELKTQIIEEMTSNGLFNLSTEDGISAKIVDKQNFKYLDELAIMKYLKENGYDQFIKQSIDTTNMNKELKKSSLLAENLKNLYSVTTNKTLMVKEEK